MEQFEEVAGIGEAGRMAAAAEVRRDIPRERPQRVRDALAGQRFVTKKTLGLQLRPQTTREMGAAIGSATVYRVTKRRIHRLLDIMQQSQADLERLCTIVGQDNEAIRAASSLMVEQIVARSNSVRPTL